VLRLSTFLAAHGKLVAPLARQRVSLEDLTTSSKTIVAAGDEARASSDRASSARDITVQVERRRSA
jgi:hypothetical protein